MHQINHKQQSKNLIISIALNLVITISQALGGFLAGSTALLSDALHNFSDVLALIISWIASKLALKKPGTKYTFGFKRAEILAAFINSLTLIVIGIFLIFEALKRFYNPTEIESLLVIIFAIVSILLNGISVLILHHDSQHSLNVKSAYIHLLTDMITSIAVLVGGLLMYYFEIFWIDGVLTIIIAIYLIYISTKLLFNSVKVLMLFTPSEVLIEEISQSICKIPEISNIHHVHIWQLTEKQTHFEAHVDFNKNLELEKVNEILDIIKLTLLENFQIQHVTLQPEFNSCHKKELIY